MDVSMKMTVFLLVTATASAFPTKHKQHLFNSVRQIYKDTMMEVAAESLGYNDPLLIPQAVQDLVHAITTIQLPLIVPQIKEEIRNLKHKADEKEMTIKKMVEEFVQRIHLDEFLTSQKHLQKRDDDYEFPNYMDSLYGGFGKK